MKNKKLKASYIKLWIQRIMLLSFLLLGISMIIICIINMMSSNDSSSLSKHGGNTIFVNANDDTMTNRDDATTMTRVQIGFGTAALGDQVHETILTALRSGFRIFDTAEADYWYDQQGVGTALQEYFTALHNNGESLRNDEHEQQRQQRIMMVGDDENRQQQGTERNCRNVDDDSDGSCHAATSSSTDTDTDSHDDASSSAATSSYPTLSKGSLSAICEKENVLISTKIGPWDLISEERIRTNAANSRSILVGFCDTTEYKYPLDVYYIHAPKCWNGWHHRCTNVGNTLSLRQVWIAMEKIVAVDHNAQRIGLSNISPYELLDIIHFVQERQNQKRTDDDSNIPRMPDAVQAYSDPIYPNHELRHICQQYHIEFVSYSTLGTQHVMKDGQQNPVLYNPIILELAKQYQRSTAEIVLSWALQHHMSIIPRSTNPHHIQQLSRLLIYNNHKTTNENIGFLHPDDFEKVNTLSKEKVTTS